MSRSLIRNVPTAVRKLPQVASHISALALLTLTIGVGNAATSSVHPEAQLSPDRLEAEQIRAALAADPVHYFRHVNVRVRNGVATLSGFVWESQDIYSARTLAAHVPGVTRVVDQMELKQEDR